MKIKFVVSLLAAALIFSALLPALPAQASYNSAPQTAAQSTPPGAPPPPPGPTPPPPPSPPVQPHPNPYPYDSYYSCYPSYHSYPSYNGYYGYWPWVGTYRWYVKPVTPVTVTTVARYSYAPVINSFSANPSYIQPWETATLVWNVSNASNVLISPSVGSVANNGSFTVQPAYTTTYTLTANNSGGTVSASTTVTVAPVVTSYSTSATTDPLVTSGTTDIAAGSTSSSPAINSWLWYALLIALVGVAAAVIIYLARRKPAAAYASTRASGCAAMTDVSTGTGMLQTRPATAGHKAMLVSSSGEQIDLSRRLGALGRNDFKPLVKTDRADLISRQHIMVSYEDGRYYIEDRSSTNGTRLNGSSITGTGRHILSEGDTVELGNVLTLTFRS